MQSSLKKAILFKPHLWISLPSDTEYLLPFGLQFTLKLFHITFHLTDFLIQFFEMALSLFNLSS